jgi:hypothetical protein
MRAVRTVTQALILREFDGRGKGKAGRAEECKVGHSRSHAERGNEEEVCEVAERQ